MSSVGTQNHNPFSVKERMGRGLTSLHDCDQRSRFSSIFEIFTCIYYLFQLESSLLDALLSYPLPKGRTTSTHRHIQLSDTWPWKDSSHMVIQRSSCNTKWDPVPLIMSHLMIEVFHFCRLWPSLFM